VSGPWGYRFEQFELDLRAARLFHARRPVPLAPRELRLLAFLIQNRGRLVDKTELHQEVWEGAVVTDSALSRSIARLRQALGDDPEAPRFIETAHGLGYRFLPEVEKLPPGGESEGGAPSRSGWITVTAVALTVAAAVFLALRWRGAERVSPSAELRAQQLTVGPGVELFPSLSPDGAALAYAGNASGRFEIYVRQIGRGRRELQVTSGGSAVRPSWSPDGRWIAYARSAPEGGIWVVPALGGSPRQLTDFGSCPSWSPDGRQIAFQSSLEFGSWYVGSPPATPPSRLWIVPAEGGEPRPLTRPGEPAGGHGAPSWSPDGKLVAFSSSDYPRTQLWVLEVASGTLRQVLDWGMDPVFAPDGAQLYFAAGSRGIWRIPVSPATGEPRGEPQQIFPTAARHPTLDGGGRRLAFSVMGLQSDLSSIPLAAETGLPTGPPAPLTEQTAVRAKHPSFSPEGDRLLFKLERRGGCCDLWTMDADGANPIQLPVESSTGAWPQWLTGGRITVPVKGALRYFDLERGTLSEAIRLQRSWRGPQLSPDGRWLAFHREQGGRVNLWKVEVRGGEPQQLTDEDHCSYPRWSPDGRFLAAELQGQGVNVGLVPAEGGEVEQITHGLTPAFLGRWSPDGRRVLLAAPNRDRWNVYWVSVRDHQVVQITHFEERWAEGFVRYPIWSPRGDQIVFERARAWGDVWLGELTPPVR
jgi:Tol biopolymer transport system component/DNA-binding winged helix-turn-helix (wHTH) protein